MKKSKWKWLVNKPSAQWLFSDIWNRVWPNIFFKVVWHKKKFYQQMSRKWFFFAGSAVLGVRDRHREQKTVSNESVDPTQLNFVWLELPLKLLIDNWLYLLWTFFQMQKKIDCHKSVHSQKNTSKVVLPNNAWLGWTNWRRKKKTFVRFNLKWKVRERKETNY